MSLRQRNNISIHRSALEGCKFVQFINTPVSMVTLVSSDSSYRHFKVSTERYNIGINGLFERLDKGYLAVIYQPNDDDIFWEHNTIRASFIQLTDDERKVLSFGEIKDVEEEEIKEENNYKYLLIR